MSAWIHIPPDGDLGDLADELERIWLEGRVPEMIARMRATHAEDERIRRRNSADTIGNVIAVDFGKGGAS